ncbi:MAG: hypothetical protein RIM84_00680 [Alphaproteobacteria bacterium]
MQIDDDYSYDAALRRLIDLRFAEDRSEASDAEVQRLEAAIHAMVKRQDNPAPSGNKS